MVGAAATYVRRRSDYGISGGGHVRVDRHPHVHQAGYAWRPRRQDRREFSWA